MMRVWWRLSVCLSRTSVLSREMMRVWWRLSVCLSRTSVLSRGQRGLGRLKLAQRQPMSHMTRTQLSGSKVNLQGTGILWRPPTQLVLSSQSRRLFMPLFCCGWDKSKKLENFCEFFFGEVGCVTSINRLDFGGELKPGIFLKGIWPLCCTSNTELHEGRVQWPWQRSAVSEFSVLLWNEYNATLKYYYYAPPLG